MKTKKMRAILSCTLLVILLVGCSKTQDELHSERLMNYLRNYVNFDYDRDENTESMYKADFETFLYQFELIPDYENERDGLQYRIVKMSFISKGIDPDVTYSVTYPDKTRIVNEGDDLAAIDKLETRFHEKLKEYDLTWEELDDFMMWKRLFSAKEKKIEAKDKYFGL